MELTLLQLSQHTDYLFDAIHYAIQGKLPIKLINPITLQNILRNVSLKLPEGYELIAGTSLDNIHLYYDLNRVSVVANVHSIILLLNVPLKPAKPTLHFVQNNCFAIRISSDKYVQYIIDHAYLAVQHRQQAYILLSGTDFNRCTMSSFTVCPADIAVYQAQAFTCEFSLYFQIADSHHLCRRQLLNHKTPFRHGSIWIFHFPLRLQITLHCPVVDNRMSYNLFLEATGLLHNANTCHVTSADIQLLPELHSTQQGKYTAPKFILPDNVSIATEQEIQQLKDVTPATIH
jgi:hypothetical protein